MEVPEPLWVPIPALNHWEIFTSCCPTDVPLLAIVLVADELGSVTQPSGIAWMWPLRPSPAALSGASSARIWPLKLACNSATAHLDKALNRLKKLLY